MVDQNVESASAAGEYLHVGEHVDVRNRFVGAWCHGYELVEKVADGYRVRRSSDGSIFPDVFGRDDVRSDKRNPGQWWH